MGGGPRGAPGRPTGRDLLGGTPPSDRVAGAPSGAQGQSPQVRAEVLQQKQTGRLEKGLGKGRAGVL